MKCNRRSKGNTIGAKIGPKIQEIKEGSIKLLFKSIAEWSELNGTILLKLNTDTKISAQEFCSFKTARGECGFTG